MVSDPTADESERKQVPDSMTDNSELRGAPAKTVHDAIDGDVALSGTGGFAGYINGMLVRDVLGRQPIFLETAGQFTQDVMPDWAFDPLSLEAPAALPAGAVYDPSQMVISGTDIIGGSKNTVDTDSDTSSSTNTDIAEQGSIDGEKSRFRFGYLDIDQHWSLPDPPVETNDDVVRRRVQKAIITQTQKDDSGTSTAVAFSGGVDSAMVAAGRPESPCYVAGFNGCHDITAAKEAIAAMDSSADLRVVEISHTDIIESIPRLVSTIGRTNPMDLAITIPLFLVAQRVAADGFDQLALGQGADELFGGYAKVQKAPTDPRVNATTVRDARRELLETIPKQAERDILAIRASGVEPVTPFLHDDIVEPALTLPESLLVRGDQRKVALRMAADGIVPESVRTASKKAVQYGTYVSRELDRLARQNGFKRRMDNHVQKYVHSLIE